MQGEQHLNSASRKQGQPYVMPNNKSDTQNAILTTIKMKINVAEHKGQNRKPFITNKGDLKPPLLKKTFENRFRSIDKNVDVHNCTNIRKGDEISSTNNNEDI